MSRTEIQRDYTGKMHLVVDGAPVGQATVHKIDVVGSELSVWVTIPVKDLVFGEVSNVVPLVRPIR